WARGCAVLRPPRAPRGGAGRADPPPRHSPAWAAPITGVPAERIVALARRYATNRPAMILMGGSSMHQGAGTRPAGGAIGCLPALTGNVGVPGGGFGPRHGGPSHG